MLKANITPEELRQAGEYARQHPGLCYQKGGHIRHHRAHKGIGGTLLGTLASLLPFEEGGRVSPGTRKATARRGGSLRRAMGGQAIMPGASQNPSTNAAAGSLAQNFTGYQDPFSPGMNAGHARGGSIRGAHRQHKFWGGVLTALAPTLIQGAGSLLSNLFGGNRESNYRGGRIGRTRRAQGGAAAPLNINYTLKKGGRCANKADDCMSNPYADNGPVKKAMGGAAKIRHHQMTKSGRQIVPRSKASRAY